MSFLSSTGDKSTFLFSSTSFTPAPEPCSLVARAPHPSRPPFSSSLVAISPALGALSSSLIASLIAWAAGNAALRHWRRRRPSRQPAAVCLPAKAADGPDDSRRAGAHAPTARGAPSAAAPNRGAATAQDGWRAPRRVGVKRWAAHRRDAATAEPRDESMSTERVSTDH